MRPTGHGEEGDEEEGFPARCKVTFVSTGVQS